MPPATARQEEHGLKRLEVGIFPSQIDNHHSSIGIPFQQQA
jgi:hypothetical protein